MACWISERNAETPMCTQKVEQGQDINHQITLEPFWTRIKQVGAGVVVAKPIVGEWLYG